VSFRVHLTPPQRSHFSPKAQQTYPFQSASFSDLGINWVNIPRLRFSGGLPSQPMFASPKLINNIRHASRKIKQLFQVPVCRQIKHALSLEIINVIKKLK